MKTTNQLLQIAKSYDRHFIEYGNDDSLGYDNLPEYMTSNPNYPSWESELASGYEDQRRMELKDFLSPTESMNFIHLGCSMNLVTRGYDEWPSIYHGVDISHETIQTLNDLVRQKNISVGSLHCGSIHETPFADDFFDIGECIGVLEYYERDFVLQAIKEIHRIMKHDGKVVLDIPNTQSPSGKMAMLIEECMGRPDKFDMLPYKFEEMIADYFIIEDSDRIRAESCGATHTKMVYFYCLRCKK